MQSTPSNSDYQDVLDCSSEQHEIEFKEYLIPATDEKKSKLAKEICALCNSGGGWVILGRKDNGEYFNYHSVDQSLVDHESINNIASTYLEPAPDCKVKWMKPKNEKNYYPIIYVPDFTTFSKYPVIAKRNGPQNGKIIEGIRKNNIHVRLSGPKSSPIQEPCHFQNLIQKSIDYDIYKKISEIMYYIKNRIILKPKIFMKKNRNI